MPARKEVAVDVHGVKNDNDVIYRIRKAFHLFTHVPEEEYRLRVEKGHHQSSWDAFSDDISDLHFPEEPDVQEVILIVSGAHDIANNISKDTYVTLLRILASNTDPAQRVDGINFFFQIRD